MSSIHDLAIAAMVEKLKIEGKVAINNHIHPRQRTGRQPDIIVENPSELYEVEVLKKNPLPKQNGTRRILLIVTSLDWDEMLVASDTDFRKASEIQLTLHTNFDRQRHELDGKIESKKRALEILQKRLLEVESKLSRMRKEKHRLSSFLSSSRIKKLEWDLYLLECLKKEQLVSAPHKPEEDESEEEQKKWGLECVKQETTFRAVSSQDAVLAT